MEYRQFGNTEMQVSAVGFGAWAIGGPAMAGDIPIGWGKTDDATAVNALHAAMDTGINFYDTADFYGLGHSEELIGQVWGNRDDVIIASKVGHRLDPEGQIFVDYSREYILRACEASLKRLRRDCIDFYQLHTAKVGDFESGDCIEALTRLQEAGKIRYWGVSLNTYAPEPEGRFLLDQGLGQGMQIVLNLINQQALPLIREAGQQGMGIIARMPLQFGLLTGKFTRETRFEANDHRSFRLTPPVLDASLDALTAVEPIAAAYGLSMTELAMSFILSIPEVATVIPGIRTPAQARENATGWKTLAQPDRERLEQLFPERFQQVLALMQTTG